MIMSTFTPSSTSFFAGQPTSVKAMQILLVIRYLLALVFFVVFTALDITVGSTGPQVILYTFFAFVLLSFPIFYFLRKRNPWATRIAIVIDLLAAIPAGAFISIFLSLIVLGLSFTKTARAYFQGE